MTAEELWQAYGGKGDYEAWAFGDDPDVLAALVLSGEKTATCSAYPMYALDDEPMPKAGEYSVILDGGGNAVCVIQTMTVEILPFCEVTEEMAALEGEGDKSLAYWRRVHREFFTKEMDEAGLCFTPEMSVVFETFRVVYK